MKLRRGLKEKEMNKNLKLNIWRTGGVIRSKDHETKFQ